MNLLSPAREVAKNRQNWQNNAKSSYTDTAYMLATSQELNLGVFHDAGNIVQHYAYSPFGKIISIKNGNGGDVTDAPLVDSFYSFTGREDDKETGLYYYRARYYEPALGRFLTTDPDPGKMINPISHINKYVYVGNSPVNFSVELQG